MKRFELVKQHYIGNELREEGEIVTEDELGDMKPSLNMVEVDAKGRRIGKVGVHEIPGEDEESDTPEKQDSATDATDATNITQVAPAPAAEAVDQVDASSDETSPPLVDENAAADTVDEASEKTDTENATLSEVVQAAEAIVMTGHNKSLTPTGLAKKAAIKAHLGKEVDQAVYLKYARP